MKNNELLMYDYDGRLLKKCVGFNYPRAISRTAIGDILVADDENGVVKVHFK